MNNRSLAWIVFVGLFGANVAYALTTYPQLPERVASHFGMSGTPDSWSTAASFVRTYLIAVSALFVMFAGIAVGLGRIPNSLINLPSREYWLAPERRESTVEFMSRHMLWFGSATLLLLLDMLRQTFRVHLGKAQSLEHPMLSLLGYLIFTGVWCIALVMRFLSPRNPQAGGTRPA